MINIETKKMNKREIAGQIISKLMDYEANGRIQLVVDTNNGQKTIEDAAAASYVFKDSPNINVFAIIDDTGNFKQVDKPFAELRKKIDKLVSGVKKKDAKILVAEYLKEMVSASQLPVIYAVRRKSIARAGGGRMMRYNFHIPKISDYIPRIYTEATLPIKFTKVIDMSDFTKEIALLVDLKFNKDETATANVDLIYQTRLLPRIKEAMDYKGDIKLCIMGEI